MRNDRQRPTAGGQHDDDFSQGGHDNKNSSTTSTTKATTMLRRKTSAPSWSSYQTTSITKLYELNQQVLQAFDAASVVVAAAAANHGTTSTDPTAAVDSDSPMTTTTVPVLQQSLALGLQYCETCLLELPKHGYYTARRHERERLQSCLEAVRVSRCLLDEIVPRLLVVQQQQQEKQENQGNKSTSQLTTYVQKLSELALYRVQEALQDQGTATTTATTREPITTDPMTSTSTCTLPSSFSSSSSNLSSCQAPLSWDWTSWCQEFPEVVLCPPSLRRNATVPAATASSSTTTALFGKQPSQQSSLLNDDESEYVVVGTDDDCDVSRSQEHNRLQQQHDAMSMVSSIQDQVTTTRRRRRPSPGQQPSLQQDYVTPAQSMSASVASSAAAVKAYPSSSSASAAANSSTSSVASLRTRQYDSQYQQQHGTIEEQRLLEQALYLSGWDATSASNRDDVPSQQQSAVAARVAQRQHQQQQQHVEATRKQSSASFSASLPFNTLAKCYHEDFDQLRASGHVRISFANTYQGRIPGSTNGCTVIAPLLCIHHLLDHQIPDPGLPDAVIEHVIDDETPAILQQLRQELGLSEHAFLIPSDSHEYLIENGQLSQDQFFDVIGGNVLDDAHLQAFVGALEHAKQHKVAACLFFHEHVVTILKLQREHNSNGRRQSALACWYDVIDGLPLKETLARVGQSDESLLGTLSLTESEHMMSQVFLPKTARIRCLTAEALTACLRWYACSKFTPENVKYIDQYAWSDNSCDFDPRVFQGFIWGSIDQ